MAFNKAELCARLDDLRRVDAKAVSPGGEVLVKDRASETALAESGAQESDALAFEKAGWTFVKPGGYVASSGHHDVVVDSDGRLKVVGHALNVRFDPTLSRKDADDILGRYGLSIRREMGFAPNLFLVTGAQTDAVSKAKLLNGLESVVYAEPVLIEPIEGR